MRVIFTAILKQALPLAVTKHVSSLYLFSIDQYVCNASIFVLKKQLGIQCKMARKITYTSFSCSASYTGNPEAIVNIRLFLSPGS